MERLNILRNLPIYPVRGGVYPLRLRGIPTGTTESLNNVRVKHEAPARRSWLEPVKSERPGCESSFSTTPGILDERVQVRMTSTVSARLLAVATACTEPQAVGQQFSQAQRSAAIIAIATQVWPRQKLKAIKHSLIQPHRQPVVLAVLKAPSYLSLMASFCCFAHPPHCDPGHTSPFRTCQSVVRNGRSGLASLHFDVIPHWPAIHELRC